MEIAVWDRYHMAVLDNASGRPGLKVFKESQPCLCPAQGSVSTYTMVQAKDGAHERNKCQN